MTAEHNQKGEPKKDQQYRDAIEGLEKHFGQPTHVLDQDGEIVGSYFPESVSVNEFLQNSSGQNNDRKGCNPFKRNKWKPVS